MIKYKDSLIFWLISILFTAISLIFLLINPIFQYSINPIAMILLILFIYMNPRSNISSKNIGSVGMTYDKFKRCLYFKSLLPIKIADCQVWSSWKQYYLYFAHCPAVWAVILSCLLYSLPGPVVLPENDWLSKRDIFVSVLLLQVWGRSGQCCLAGGQTGGRRMLEVTQQLGITPHTTL